MIVRAIDDLPIEESKSGPVPASHAHANRALGDLDAAVTILGAHGLHTDSQRDLVVQAVERLRSILSEYDARKL